MAYSPRMPDQHGRVVVVTGASSGIGLETARELARRGAHVVAAVRNMEKARRVIDFEADIQKLDLADLVSIRSFAQDISGPIDVLINNAGVMASSLTRTKDGFELQIGTNHLGHFALTGVLMERIRDRVVTVSSAAHWIGKIRLDDLNWERTFHRWPAYAQSKLANLLFTSELQRRLTLAGSPVKALAAHPGYAATAIGFEPNTNLFGQLMKTGNKFFAQSQEQGAWPTLLAATGDLPGNTFVGPRWFAQMRGEPKVVGRSSAAHNDEVARQLWALSESLTGVTFDLPEH